MSEHWLQRLGVIVPVVQAPMAGSVGAAMVVAVTGAGGLGSLPCALLSADAVRAEVATIRQTTDGPFNLNFFCHERVPDDGGMAAAVWLRHLQRYFDELGLDSTAPLPDVDRAPFDEGTCELIEELRPAVVSFHFGLPGPDLLDRVRATGATVLSSATTVDEARWLEAHGADVVIAQGVEAGGHRGMFLTTDIATQLGTFALVPQIVDAVAVPVVAAGGIADVRGVAAAAALGASAVQPGTAFLRCPEATTSPVHRAALAVPSAVDTALTNVLTGRPARSIVTRLMTEVGPISPIAPSFPLAAAAVAPLRRAAEATGSGHFSPLWAGQSAALATDAPAAEVVWALGAGFPPAE